ncbi:TonB family protein [candidate division KSB1 bacterium]|nr:MAG: TonB family protein [candidate division KSB1 bacterium]
MCGTDVSFPEKRETGHKMGKSLFRSGIVLLCFITSLRADVNGDLLEAARRGSLEAMQTALSAGADINAENILGETALFAAIDECRTEAVRLLISKGARLDYLTKLNYTPLMKAASEGCADIVRLLMDAKVDINRSEPKQKHTPLLKAVLFNRPEIVAILVVKGAKINVADKFGNTPLMLAARSGHIDIVDFLISKGADVNAKTLIGHTALLYALEFGQPEIAKMLISQGADVKSVDMYNNSTLMLAAARGYSDIVESLVAKGVDVNLKTKKDQTAAVLAQKKAHDDIVQFLLQSGADSTGLVFVDSTALAAEQARAEMYDTPPEAIGGMEAVQKRLRYPKKAKEAGLTGEVKLRVTVDKRGRVAETEILESFGDEECDKAAQSAVQGSRWKAAEKEKTKVEAWVDVVIEFKLDETPSE